MLRDLQAIYTIYQEKSFSKAAEKLFVSQPALSATVKKIEKQIQVPIFDRSSNPVQLTVAGEYYIGYIEKMLSLQTEMESYFANIRKDKSLVLNIGGATFFCAHILPSIIEGFQNKYPHYTVNILEGNAQDLNQCLKSGIIDLSLDVEKLDSNLYTSLVWTKEHIILAVPATYKINAKFQDYSLSLEAVRNKVYLADNCPKICISSFKEQPFLMLKRGNDMYKRGYKICKNAGFAPNVFMYFDQMLTSYYVAKDGKGIAFVRAAISEHVETTPNLCFYKLDDENAVRPIMINYKNNSSLSAIAQDFIKYLTLHNLY